MRDFFRIGVVLLLFLQLCSCKKQEANPNKDLRLEAFAELKESKYVIRSARIRQYLDQQMRKDADSMLPDHRTRTYYQRGGAFLWIDKLGVGGRADTLLAYLQDIEKIGFTANRFGVDGISSDLERLRNLDFDEDGHTINHVLARLEYRLTKAYLRYANGYRYGFTNPYALFNRLDVRRKDSLNVVYEKLFDIPVERPSKDFWAKAIEKVRQDSVSSFLADIQPKSRLYQQIKQYLPLAQTKAARARAICNLERARWRLDDEPSKHNKYAIINLPSMHLMAVEGKTNLSMRVGIGAPSTKTPLLTSRIMRMDVNPQWVMPKSIIEKSVVQHAGDRAYFEGRRYFIRDRKTGERIDPSEVTADMLRSGNYFVIQEGGKGNAMGRIVFRFKNNFAVYLHDTSSPDVFERSNRGVSHGCVRLAKPFDFAVFLLGDKDESTIQKIRYSMAADIHSANQDEGRGRSAQETDTLKRSMLIRSVGVKPEIPLFITYYTLYPDEQNQLTSYPDVYGYDEVIYRQLVNYIK